MFLPPWRHAKYKGQTKFKIRFFCVYPLVLNEICTNFHCMKKSEYENNIELNVPAPMNIYLASGRRMLLLVR